MKMFPDMCMSKNLFVTLPNHTIPNVAVPTSNIHTIGLNGYTAYDKKSFWALYEIDNEKMFRHS